MRQDPPPSSSEAAIGGRPISPEAARGLLELRFGADDQGRLRERSRKAQDGTLSAVEQVEIEKSRRTGHSLGILWSKARLSLENAGSDAAQGREA